MDDDEINLGDIVEWGGRRWDVAGWRAEGHARMLMLERKTRQTVSREWVDERAVVLIGCQVLMPGMPPPEARGGPDHRA